MFLWSLTACGYNMMMYLFLGYYEELIFLLTQHCLNIPIHKLSLVSNINHHIHHISHIFLVHFSSIMLQFFFFFSKDDLMLNAKLRFEIVCGDIRLLRRMLDRLSIYMKTKPSLQRYHAHFLDHFVNLF